MKNKKWLIALISVIILSAVGYKLYLYFGPHYATTYEDAGGWVYRCSQPILVKDQGVTYMNGQPSLTPVNKSEAAKYCSSFGIE